MIPQRTPRQTVPYRLNSKHGVRRYLSNLLLIDNMPAELKEKYRKVSYCMLADATV